MTCLGRRKREKTLLFTTINIAYGERQRNKMIIRSALFDCGKRIAVSECSSVWRKTGAGELPSIIVLV